MGELSEDDIAALKKLVPLADEIAKDAEYQKSRTVVWQHWKAVLISFAALLTAVILIWDRFKAGAVWLFR